MKNKISIGLGCLFIGIPLPTYIHHSFNTLQKKGNFSLFDTFYAYGTGGYIVVALLTLITLWLFTVAIKELGALMINNTQSSHYKKL